jgi:hypothetical protein
VRTHCGRDRLWSSRTDSRDDNVVTTLRFSLSLASAFVVTTLRLHTSLSAANGSSSSRMSRILDSVSQPTVVRGPRAMRQPSSESSDKARCIQVKAILGCELKPRVRA